MELDNNLEQDNVDVTPEENDEGIIADPIENPSEDDWQPEFKFKVMDQEHEIPEYMRSVINKENYDEVRGLYEKAYGLEHVKTKKTALEEELKGKSEMEKKYLEQNQMLGYMGGLLKNKDYHNLFSQLKIPENDVLQYALDRVKYQDLSQDEKIAYDKGIEERNKLYTLEKQNQDLQQKFQDQAVQARTAELDNALNTSQYESAVKNFDQRAGKPGAFKEEVIRRGQLHYYQTGQDLSVQNAVDEVLRLYGNNQQSSGQGMPPNVPNNTQASVNTPHKPVIPNVPSGGGSPARKLPRTIEDIKRAAEAFN